jgi:hypothetical protein
MAAFPAIEPLNRSYGLGSHVVGAADFPNADQTRFLHSSAAVDVPIALEFVALTTSEATQIRDHYLGQKQHQPFAIPAALWRTHASLYDVVPGVQLYRYAEAPIETPRTGGLVDVAVSLISVL